MIIVGLLVFFIGIVLCGGAFYYALKKRQEAVEYKRRWQGAVELLQEQGKVTDEQMKELLGKIDTDDGLELPQEQLYKMADPYRVDVAIARAKQGLPPNDNLRGMRDVYVAEVMAARAKQARKKR